MKDDQAEKRALHALLREYKANIGMAGMVCSRPVELLPKEEQDRLFEGFFTPANAEAFRYSRGKLEEAKSLPLDDSERVQVEEALKTISQLVHSFSRYQSGELSREDIRKEVRTLLHFPIPESEDELIESLSHCVKTLIFLGDQPLDSKDHWDRLVDCVQLHDALSRGLEVGEALSQIVAMDHFSPGAAKPQSESVNETLSICSRSREQLEDNFKSGNIDESALAELFSELSKNMKRLWYSDEE